MKRETLWQGVSVGAIAFCIAFGGMGCLATGFNLTGVSMGWLALWSALFAFGFAFALQYRMGLLIGCGLGVAGGFLWRSGSLAVAVEALIYSISSDYNKGYGWPVIAWSGQALNLADMTPALCAISCGISFLLAWVMCRRCKAWLAVPVSLLPLGACVVLTDTVPSEWYLYPLLLGVTVLMLTQSVRRRDPQQGVTLTLRAALAAAVVLGVLFLAVPQKGYTGQIGAEKLEKLVTDLFQGVDLTPEKPSLNVDVGLLANGDSTNKINLQNVGPKSYQTERVMDVTATKSGILYLRGRSYDHYNGQRWISSGQPSGLEIWPEGSGMSPYNYITITTRQAHSVRYFPYYSPRLWELSNGKQSNEGNAKTYTVEQMVPKDGYRYDWDRNWTRKAWEQNGYLYLQLPEQTQMWAEALVVEILQEPLPLAMDETTPAKIEKILRYVRDSARYDLDTQRMPAGEADFTRWFLENSDTGYCVHFATSAAVLLRAAGIPCRYVTGYMVYAQAEASVPVRLADAHAWVEYCLPDGVWTMGEATPSGGTSPVQPLPTEPEPTETQPTEPGETQTDETQPPQNEEDTFQLDLGWLRYVLWALAAVGVTVGQWRLRVFLRRQAQYAGRPNQQALARWRELTRLSRLTKKKPETALYELAQKAKYSQHTISREELQQFNRALTETKQELRQKSFFHQMVYCLVFAIY